MPIIFAEQNEVTILSVTILHISSEVEINVSLASVETNSQDLEGYHTVLDFSLQRAIIISTKEMVHWWIGPSSIVVTLLTSPVSFLGGQIVSIVPPLHNAPILHPNGY